MNDTVELAVLLIDEFLRTTSRDLIPGTEVMDLLLDVRALLNEEAKIEVPV